MKLDENLSVDVIIPTLNSEKSLEDCLRSLSKQRFTGKLNIVVIDGGSTDRTIEIAKNFSTSIYVKKGMYGTGKNGARHYGELLTNSPFIWNVDSDNIIVDDTALERLVEPLILDSTINISIPLTALDKKVSSFNNWISLNEIRKVENMAKKGIPYKDGYLFLTDMDYGLTNCALVRRTAIENVGGYDSDVRTLGRLRSFGLSKGVIDTKSHFYHNQVDSVLQYLKKWNRRLKFFSKMSKNDLKNYFVENPNKYEEHKNLQASIIWEILSSPFNAPKMFYKSGESMWLWGVVYPFFIIALGFLHPIRTLKVFKRFL